MKKQKILFYVILGISAVALVSAVLCQGLTALSIVAPYTLPYSGSQINNFRLVLTIISVALCFIALCADIFLCVYIPRNLFDRATIERNAEHKKAERLAKKREKLQKQLDELPRN